MDAFELTRPVLATTRLRTSRRPSTDDGDAGLATARRFVAQLPLGRAPRPLAGRDRLSATEARRQLEQALWRLAAAQGVAVGVDESTDVLARRLARVRAMAPPAADAVVALLRVLDAGETESAKLAERVIGYLESRL